MESPTKHVKILVMTTAGKGDTLLGTNISPPKGTFEDDFPFPQVGCVSSLEGTVTQITSYTIIISSIETASNICCVFVRGLACEIYIQSPPKEKNISIPPVVEKTHKKIVIRCFCLCLFSGKL